MPRMYLVPGGAAQPEDDGHGGRVVHQYPNGASVVDKRRARDQPAEPLPASGLQLPATASRSAVAAARQAITDAANGPIPEQEPEVSAYVEFIAPPDPRWLGELESRDITLVAYQPDFSYLVRGRPSSLAVLTSAVRTTSGDAAIRSVVELTSELKAAPRTLAEAGENTVIVFAASGAEQQRVVNALRSVPGVQPLPGAGNDVLDAHRVRVRARVDPMGLQNLLDLSHVLSVESYAAAVPDDELAGLIIAGELDPVGRPRGSYDQWLAAHELDGRGAVIGIVDGGVDVSHPAFAGRARDLAGGRKDWHATMVAGHAAGAYRTERDPAGFIYGLGTAPASVVLSQDRNAPASTLCSQTVSEAASGFAVQNNSWGRGGSAPMDYGSEEALYDALVRNARGGDAPGPPLTICFSSGNTGAAGLTRPKAAKNLIVTGNSENYRPDIGGADGDSVGDVYVGSHASSHGNCADGRIRPHLVAPGEWTASAAFDVVPGEPDYVSALITWGGGSSGASPKTAGACALLAQWWRRWHDGVDPSPAMLRALLVNGAEPIHTGGPIPNNVQGWGRLSLRALLDPHAAMILQDESRPLAAPLETRRWSVRVVDPTNPVKVTLAWTDPPGAVGSGTAAASCIVNRLALRVEQGARVWRGSVDRFRGGWTVDDASLASPPSQEEVEDNLQCVFLAPGQAQTLTVSVTAVALSADALHGGFATPQQDFALVISNAALDTSATDTTVVVGLVSSAAAPESANRDEAEWWSVGAPSVPEATRRTGALDAAGFVLNETADGVSAVVIPGEGRVGTVADAVRDRLSSSSVAAAVVLGIPSGYVASDDDVAGLRALASTTDLYLVAAGAGDLSAVAAAIGYHARVRYRLADVSATVADTLRDAVLEAGGLQQLVVSDWPVATGRGVRFEVIGADGTLVVGFPDEAMDLYVTRPGGPAGGVRVTEHPVDGVRAAVHEGCTQVVVERAGEHPGAWTITAGNNGAPPSVWVDGPGAGLTVDVRPLGPTRTLLRVDAPPGSLLKQLTIPRHRLNPTDEVQEIDRPMVVGVRPSRLDGLGEGIAPEASGRTLPVPSLGRVVEVPAGAWTVLDVPVDVFGADADGSSFARRVHADVFAATDAGDAAEAEATVRRVTGYIDEVLYAGSVVTGVRVTNGERVRILAVADDRLGAAIAQIDRDRAVILGVRGDDLEWVFVPLE